VRAKFHDPMLIIIRDPPIKLAERDCIQFAHAQVSLYVLHDERFQLVSGDTENALQQVQEVMHDALENKE